MAKEDIDKFIREHLAAYSAQDWEKYKAGLTDDATYEEEATGRRVQGREQFVQTVRSWLSGFPDLKATVKSLMAAGDKAVVEVAWEGTHKGTLDLGPLGKFQASGKRGQVPAAQVFTIENGKIRELKHYFDLMTVLRLIGAMPGAERQPSP